jgi:hypothetical protein
MSEPTNLHEWRRTQQPHVYGRLYTAGRPGRGTPGYGRTHRSVDETIIDRWVEGLPAAEVLHIVSLLGRKTTAVSEFLYYPFRSIRETGSKPTFQEWLDHRYGPRFRVYEFPTTDARGIENEVMADVTNCVGRLLDEGRTVLVIDSAGAERTARVCESIGWER